MSDLIERAREGLRARLDSQFLAALQADPVCGGRVSSGTVDWLVSEALRACEAVERKAAEHARRQGIEEAAGVVAPHKLMCEFCRDTTLATNEAIRALLTDPR